MRIILFRWIILLHAVQVTVVAFYVACTVRYNNSRQQSIHCRRRQLQSTCVPSADHNGKNNFISQGNSSQYDNENVPPNFLALVHSIQSLSSLPVDASRIFHGRGGMYLGLEHITLDWFPPVWLLTSYGQVLSERDLEWIGTILELKWNALAYKPSPQILSVIGPNIDNTAAEGCYPFTWVYQSRQSIDASNLSSSSSSSAAAAAAAAATRTTRGLSLPQQSRNTLVKGQIPHPNHIVTERECCYYVKLLESKNHGIFLDMAHGRRWVQEHAQHKRVLNLFAYTCAFSVAAIQGGASEVINVDMIHNALKIGQRNHELNDRLFYQSCTTQPTNPTMLLSASAGRVRFLAHDVFKSWGKLQRLGPYDMVIVDPPSYQKGSFIASKDYGKVIRRIPTLLNDAGWAVLCLNAPELDTSFLRDLVLKEAPELMFVKRLDNPPSFPSKDQERALKVMIYQKPVSKVNLTILDDYV